MVTVLCGDNAQCEQEISTSLNMGIPVVVLQGSAISNVIMSGSIPTPTKQNGIT